MPLQNRVDPFGQIHAVAARGMFCGNRGVIHDPQTKTLLKRRWTSRAWIICRCEFRQRRRDVMGRNAPGGGAGWTELFFLDEVTALAAGHRPCFFCQRQRAKEFAGYFGDAYGIAEPKAAEIDRRLHAERRASGGDRVLTSRDALRELPDGAMLAIGEEIVALKKPHLLAWRFEGYRGPSTIDTLPGRPISVLTPATSIAVLAAGYRPIWHDSAAKM